MISIVVTAYNVGQYIEESVISALSQTCRDIEVIVVEDCSTDDTMLRLAMIDDERLTVLQNEENLGAGMSRRVGIEHAKGDYILLLDGDDYLTPDFIEALAKRAAETDADVVSGGITVVSDKVQSYVYGEQVVEGAEQITRFFGEHVVFMNNKIIRRSLYDNVQYCGWRYIEDTPTIAKILYYSKSTAYVNNSGYVYRQNPQSLCHKASQFKTSLYRALCAKDLYEFFKHKGEVYSRMFGLHLFMTHIRELRAENPTAEEIAEYQEQWNEVAKFLIDLQY